MTEPVRPMPSPADDLQNRLEYAQSHQTARGLLVFAIVAFSIGSFILATNDGWDTDAQAVLIGGVSLASAVAALAIAVRTMRQPTVAGIVLSPEGVLFGAVSQTPIPWHEISAVATAEVRLEADYGHTKVTKLVVSRRFYRSLGLTSPFDARIAEEGDPSAIYLAYFHKLPFDEFYAAVQARWKAFHGRP